MSDAVEHIIGIDLGTTNSVVALMEGDRPQVIPNAEGANRTPSVVAFTDHDEVVVGEMALRQAVTNPERTVSAVKRLMGRFFSDVAEQDEDRPYRLFEKDDHILIDINGSGYSPQQVSSLILARLKAAAEDYLDEEVKKAVITVPAYFDDLQRQATVEAAELAGLEVLRLINEPTAAAMAYGLGRQEPETVAVYDFGGGTFDISLLDVDRNSFEVLATGGDSLLGGEDIDRLLVERLRNEFHKQYNIDLREDPLAYHRLKEACEQAKCELSTMDRARINLPFMAYKEGQPLHFERIIERREFEGLIEGLVERTISICRKTLGEANLRPPQIDKVVMVGGSSRIPLVQEMVEDFFDCETYRGVNPDEVVALGAATQAGVFEGKLEEVVLLDVTPHTLGLETREDGFSALIEKNSTIPIKAAKTFTTTEHNQEFVTVHILQGESTNASENRSLGKFTLSGLQPRPKGVPRIQITFFINTDGIVEISAKDIESGQEKSLTILHSFLDSDEQSERRQRRSRRRSRRRKRPATGSSTGPRPDFTSVDSEDGAEPMELEPIAPTPTAEADAPREEEAPLTPALGLSDRTTHREGEREGTRMGTRVVDPGDVEARLKAIGDGLLTDPSEILKVRRKAEAASSVKRDDDQTAEDVSTEEEPEEEEVLATTAEAQNAPLDEEPPLTRPAAEDLTERTRVAEALLMSGKNDDTSLRRYAEAIPDYRRMMEEDGAPELKEWAAYSLARIHALSDEPDAALSVIASAREDSLIREGMVESAYEEILAAFPGYAPALTQRALLFESRGRLTEACGDLERAAVSDASFSPAHEALERVYLKQLETDDDPKTRFKLVKVYLRQDKIDNAIETLERLLETSGQEERARRVLGLCCWQKSMYYRAWQHLKELPVDGETKDVLFRLASDMIDADQLRNARRVLEHLKSAAPDYPKVDQMLKDITARIEGQETALSTGPSRRAGYRILRDERFEILDEINRGSMGVVYRAKDTVLEEIVALKVLNDYLCSDPSAVERFKTEARAARKLTHPNIVRIHDFFEIDSKKCISMEYIAGNDLKTILAMEGHLPPERVIALGRTVAEALDYAHNRKVIHRDIKPANMMIDVDGDVRITDFGIAKIRRSDDATMTASVVMGTPLYMAPEQIRSGDVDRRSDVYSLGICLYELLTGQAPFVDGNIEYHHLHTMPPPLPSTIDPELAKVVMRSIEKDPDERFETAKAFAEALDTLVD